MANRRYIDFPIASTSGDTDIILIWQSGANKQTTKATFLSGLPENLDELNDVAISGLTNGQILRYDSVTGKWENTDQGNLDLNDLNDVQIVSPSNGQVLVYNSSTSKWENSSGGFVPYTGAVTTVNLGSQTIQAGQFVKVGGTAAQFLKANGSVDSTAYGTGSVTSVALTMPTAFSVAGSPITTAGTLAVTGAGTVGQYIRGDGSLADFPESSGGGSSVSYYLNGSVAQGTIGGVAYKELNKVPVLGAGTDFTIAADGYIASFITDAGDPNLLEISGGNWNFETYFSASSGGGSPTFYVELYKVNSGGTATLIASNSTFPELIAFGTNIISYFSTLAVPTTALALTDRLAIRYYVTHSGRTITLHTEDNHLCQIITTFTTGITALNGLTAQVQNFAVGTFGTDFAIASATATHTFNLPTASATNRGALSSADWTTFNNKTSNLGTVTSVGLSSATSGVTIGSTPVTTSGTITLAIATASGLQNGLLSSSDWSTFNGKQNALTNPVTGTGTSGQVAYFTGTTAISSESNLFWDATNDRLGVGTASPLSRFHVNTGTNQNFRVRPGTDVGATNGVALNSRTDDDGSLQQLTLRASDVIMLTSGNVGINTASPSVSFELNGRYRTTSSFSSSGTTVHEIYNASASGFGAYIAAAANTNYSFRVADYLNNPLFTINGNGNVLIGTTTDSGFKININSSTTGLNVGNQNNSVKALATFNKTLTTGFGTANNYLQLGAGENGLNGTRLIGFGYSITANTNQPAYIGYIETSNSGETNGALIFGTRSVTTDTAPTERMRITSGGNVLIGTTTDAGFKLNVEGGSVIARVSDPNTSGTNRNGGFRAQTNTSTGDFLSIANNANAPFNSNDGVYIMNRTSGSNLHFTTNNGGTEAERMRITSGGNVLIGTATDSGGKLRVDGDVFINNSSNAQIGLNTTGALNSVGAYLYFNRSGLNKWTAGMGPYTGGNNYEIATGSVVALSLAVTTGTATFGSLGTGTVSATSGTLSTTSDLNYKIDDDYIDSALDKVLNLKPRYFYWNQKSGLPMDVRQLGFYAQEVNEALGEEAANTPKNENTPWGISDRSIIAYLTKAIQELKQEIDTLKN